MTSGEPIKITCRIEADTQRALRSLQCNFDAEITRGKIIGRKKKGKIVKKRHTRGGTNFLVPKQAKDGSIELCQGES